ncbi:MAG: rRNA large subunit methyltransferase I, partial [Firmicutes bacterium]|nr:rRNA large subunit methyltransferase I [Bacillota bacterium]
MKQERSYPKVFVSPKGERSVLYGHPWIYDQEVTLPGDDGPLDGAKRPEDGTLVDA